MGEKNLEFELYDNLINKLLEKSNHDLDQFVVAKNEMDVGLEMADSVEYFLGRVIKESWQNESFVNELFAYLREKYYDSDCKLSRFLSFCEGYVENKRKPYVYSSVLRNMDWEKFVKIADFCLHNRILQVTMKQLDREEFSEEEEVIAENICYNIINMRIVKNYAKDKVEYEVEKMTGLNKEKIDYVYDSTNNYLEQLWKICMMRKLAGDD